MTLRYIVYETMQKHSNRENQANIENHQKLFMALTYVRAKGEFITVRKSFRACANLCLRSSATPLNEEQWRSVDCQVLVRLCKDQEAKATHTMSLLLWIDFNIHCHISSTVTNFHTFKHSIHYHIQRQFSNQYLFYYNSFSF